MSAGDKSPESFASLYLGNKRGGTKRPARLPVQSDLFAEPVVDVSPQTVLPPPSRPVAPAIDRMEQDTTVLETKPVRQIFTVRELVGQIRLQVERTHLSVWVEGEISNCRPAASGHLYFTLKDGEAQLPVVMFRRQAQLLGVRPKDGDAVEVRGRVSIYESRGQLQLIAETLELRGAGALELAFKRLKAKLQAEGLFEQERKRMLPPFPRCVGVVSSMQGAVIRDIVHVIRRRHARLNLLLYCAAMQGPRCAGEVVSGIRWFNSHPGMVDVIVLARGGGSIEDLAGFNQESVARAIAESALPVVSAIGHETDFTIADFVADLRAPTPSAAAELVTAAQHRIEERVLSLERRVHRAGRYQLLMARQRYMRLSAESVLDRLRDAVNRREQRLDDFRHRLEVALGRRLRVAEQRLALQTDRLRRQDPTLRLRLAQRRLDVATRALNQLGGEVIAKRTIRIERAATRLDALSPLAVLGRGYALVYNEAGILVRRAEESAPGQTIRARLAAGSLLATVKEVKP